MLNLGSPSYQYQAAHPILGIIRHIKSSSWVCTATFYYQMQVVQPWWGPSRPWGCKLHEEVAQMPIVPTPATLPSLFRPALWSHEGGSLWSADRGRRDASGLQMALYDMQTHLKVDSSSTTVPSWGFWKNSSERNPPSGQNNEQWI